MEESEIVNTEQEASLLTQDEGEELVINKGATSDVRTWFGFRKSDTVCLFYSIS